MSNKKNVHSTKITNKIRSSLVLKLNVRMVGRLFSGFLAINVLIFFMGIFVILWKAEEGAQDIIQLIEMAPKELQSSHYGAKDYKILVIEKPQNGIIFPHIIQKYLPIKNYDVKRNIKIPESEKGIGLFARIELTKYIITISIKDINYQIIYALGRELRLFIYLFFIILIFELLIIIGNLSKGSKTIRKTLKPLSELAETARSINDEVLSKGTKANKSDIKDIAGVISSIDAKKLDRRISIDSSQNELKDLASAINDMLNRINESYQSQVRFVSDASHELRTPISVIQGYINLLDRWGKEDPKTMQESIDAIKSETENMKELVEQLLFLARGDNETLRLHKELFDSCDIVDEIIRETQMIDPNHHFEIELNRPAFINADKQLFKQTIRILVDNCIKYTPNGKKISLKVLCKKDTVQIIVQDSGIGIAPEDLSYIFDRFYRSDESRARKTGGSGLGLSIAKWIIEEHDGHFEILSRVDIGTRITIILPAEKEVISEKENRDLK